MKYPERSDGRTPHDHIEDQTPAELRESAYRRGFQQGLQYALNIIKTGGTLIDLLDYMHEVTLWRQRLGSYESPRGQVRWPPVPGRLE